MFREIGTIIGLLFLLASISGYLGDLLDDSDYGAFEADSGSGWRSKSGFEPEAQVGPDDTAFDVVRHTDRAVEIHVSGNRLFVADGNRLLGFDLNSTVCVADIQIPTTEKIDDLTTDSAGALYVIDAKGRIFKVRVGDSVHQVTVEKWGTIDQKKMNSPISAVGGEDRNRGHGGVGEGAGILCALASSCRGRNPAGGREIMEAASGDVTGAAADAPVCKDGPAPSPRGTGDTNISSECISGYVGFFPAVSGIGGRSLSVDRKQGCPIIVARGVSRDAARLRADLQDRNLDFSKCRVSGEGRLFDVPFPS